MIKHWTYDRRYQCERGRRDTCRQEFPASRWAWCPACLRAAEVSR